jgi:hypothetical protein
MYNIRLSRPSLEKVDEGGDDVLRVLSFLTGDGLVYFIAFEDTVAATVAAITTVRAVRAVLRFVTFYRAHNINCLQ